MAFDDSARLVWSLTTSGLGTTISANGNSGTWSATVPNARTTVDLRRTDDLGLYVYVTAIVTTPTLKVNLDVYDDQGNLFPAVAATANIVAAGAATPVYIGRHGGASGNFVIVPDWARVSWTCSGGSCTGVEICLYAR